MPQHTIIVTVRDDATDALAKITRAIESVTLDDFSRPIVAEYHSERMLEEPDDYSNEQDDPGAAADEAARRGAGIPAHKLEID